MFDRILIPTDGSEPARKAAEKGVQLADTHGASVHAMYVIEPIPLGTFTSGPGASAGHGDIQRKQKEEAQQVLNTIAQLCEERGVECVEVMKQGVPIDEILDYVEEKGIDGIVMGTHGRSGTKRVIIGSVAEKVVRSSPVPVVTIRNNE